MNSRLVELVVNRTAKHKLQITAPKSAARFQPGWGFLWILADGVPSERSIRVMVGTGASEFGVFRKEKKLLLTSALVSQTLPPPPTPPRTSSPRPKALKLCTTLSSRALGALNMDCQRACTSRFLRIHRNLLVLQQSEHLERAVQSTVLS